MARWDRIYDLQNGQLADVEQVEEELDNLINAVNALDEEAVKSVTDGALAEVLTPLQIQRGAANKHRLHYEAGSDTLQIQRHTGASWESVLAIPVTGGMSVLGELAWFGGAQASGKVEYGSNINGHYIRFPNGIQMCWNRDFIVTVADTDNASANWTYPAAFADTFTITAVGNTAQAFPHNEYLVSTSMPNTSTATIRVRSITATSRTVDITVRVFAIGRWA